MFDITLVTSVLDGMPYLREMLASAPPDPRVEHIVIDAGSTDGSLELVATERRLRVVSRHGMPLYNAWNEGVALAKGRYILFLNADDRLAPDALMRSLDLLARHPDVDVLAGHANAFMAASGAAREATVWHYDGEILAGSEPAILLFGAPLINAKLFRRDLIAACGGFDTSYRYAADREFLLRLSQHRPAANWLHSEHPFYRYRIHDASKTLLPNSARRMEISLEHQHIACRYLSDPKTGMALRSLLAAWLAHERAVTAVRGAAAGQWRHAVAAAAAFAGEAGGSIGGLARARKIRCGYRRDLLRASAAYNDGRPE